MARQLPPAPRRLLITLGVLVALLVLIRVVLDPIAAHELRKGLTSGEDVRGDFAGVHVAILPPGVHVHRLKLIQLPHGNWEKPDLYVEDARVGLVWRQLFHGHLVADVRLDRPKVIVVPEREAAKPKKPAPPLGQTLRQQLPARLDRLEVVGGEALIAQGNGAELWIHRAHLLVENLATRPKLMEGEPAMLEGSAVVQRSGKLTMSFTMNPWTKGLTFTGKAALRDLDLRDVYALVADKSDLEAVKGTASAFVELRARNGLVSGGVKPELTGVEVASQKHDLGDKLKALAADAAVHLASHHDDRIATVIPIEGKLSDVHVEVVPAILGVVRNSFVEGISSGFANLPPPVAEKKEGILKQAVHALKKDEGPPKAQPTGTHAGRKKR